MAENDEYEPEVPVVEYAYDLIPAPLRWSGEAIFRLYFDRNASLDFAFRINT
jgi:hypothetical protein